MSAQSPDDSPEASARRDRAAIAAQACQTCRSRKSKCDEKRPKCGLCTRLKVDCIYREPQPTKKDKTLVHILQVLERVESKVDRISSPNPSTPQVRVSQSRLASDDPSTAATSISWEQIENDLKQDSNAAKQDLYLPTDLISATSHFTASHRLFLWPSIYLMLTNAKSVVIPDLNVILQEGSCWFTHIELKKHLRPLPGLGASGSPVTSPDDGHTVAASLAGLTPDHITYLADAYFDTFNIVHPILDRDSFYSDIVAPVIRGGFKDNDTFVCLAMTVLALGQMAIESVAGPPVNPRASSASGLRGGTMDHPPGTDMFNEARRRFGFVMYTCCLENVQTYLLQATYYEACARHMDYWRSCASASMAFQIFIRCERIDWSKPKADMIRRVYWTCILNEDLYHLELDLPRTGIYSLEDKIPLPSFQRTRQISATQTEASSQFHYHFLAMIALRRLLARIHASLHSDEDTKAEKSHDYDGPPIHLIKELARQLESWRTFLPQGLQWSDNDMHGFAGANPLSRRQPGPLFTVEDTGGPAGHRYNLDIVTGHLRTRFYYARYLIYRPFIFKALHFPESMTEQDMSYCALSLQSACMWPIAMSPCKNKKRLIPHLFTWTQNFVGILLIFRMVSESDCLRHICEERVNRKDMQMTISLLLEWIEDMRTIDGLAEWSWNFLEPLIPGFR